MDLRNTKFQPISSTTPPYRVPVIDAPANDHWIPAAASDRQTEGENSTSNIGAPPGFPIPQYHDVNQNLLVGFVHLPSDVRDPVIMEKERLSPIIGGTDTELLATEGAEI